MVIQFDLYIKQRISLWVQEGHIEDEMLELRSREGTE